MLANDLIVNQSDALCVSRVIDMPAGYIDDWHTHHWHQVLFPQKGLLQSSIGQESFIVPHNGMLYVPAHTLHQSIAVTETRFLSIYINPAKLPEYQQTARSCQVTAFLEALILQVIHGRQDQGEPEVQRRLLLVLWDQIRNAVTYQIPLLIPQDRRLNLVFSELKTNPSCALTLEEWAGKVGASKRTLTRVCRKEFNLSFSRWRQNLRLVLSLQKLEQSIPISQIALEVGYQSDSAYVFAFNSLFGLSPNRYRRQIQGK